MNLEVVLSNCTINIELFDIPVVRHWYHTFKNKTVDNNAFWYSMVNYNPLVDQYRDLIEHNINEIHQAKKQLESLGYTWPANIRYPEINDTIINQSVLNDLHRFFTNNWRWYIDDGQLIHGYPNPYDPAFVPPPNFAEVGWIAIIDRINLAVHELENFAVPEPTKQFIIDNQLSVDVLHINSKLNQRMRFSIEEYHHNFNFDLDDDSYPVILPNEVLGKCIMLSFSDNDNPNEVDVWGRQEAQIDFYIDLNKNRRKIYRSDVFKHWAESHIRSVQSLPLEFAIGRVQELPLPIEEFYKNDYHVLGINFV
jgi:hypothetical protein